MKCSIRNNGIYIDKIGDLSADTELNNAELEEVLNFIAGHWTLDSFGDDLGSFPFKLPSEDELILYPGSFSPWHKGHGACLRNAPPEMPLVVMPDHSPWKEVRTSGAWNEISLIWKDLNDVKKNSPERKLSLFLGFLAEQKRNPTSNWMSYFKSLYPHKKLWLLMGEDTFLSLHQWYEVKSLLQLLEGLFICPRAEERRLVETQKEIILEMAEKPFTIKDLRSHDYEHFSSTFVREST